VHEIEPDALILFDNEGNPGATSGTYASRVLDIAVTEGTSPSAEIAKSWALVDNDPTLVSPLSCEARGSGELVPADASGDTVLALCNASDVIEELNDPTGEQTHPALYISLPAPPESVCASTSVPREEIEGWYRAYPLASLGDF
jgi:hypothetical protein